MNLRTIILPFALLASASATVAPAAPASVAAPAISITDISDAYIRLTLEAGTHEAEYVDAYYGPPALQAAAKENPRSLAQLIIETRVLTAAIDVALPSIKVVSERRRAVALPLATLPTPRVRSPVQAIGLRGCVSRLFFSSAS
jgi:hypothetical protein